MHYGLWQSNLYLEKGVATNITVQFKDIPEEILGKKAWTDMEAYSCVDLIRENMELLDDCLTILVRTSISTFLVEVTL